MSTSAPRRSATSSTAGSRSTSPSRTRWQVSSGDSSRRVAATSTTFTPCCATLHRANRDAARLLRGERLAGRDHPQSLARVRGRFRHQKRALDGRTRVDNCDAGARGAEAELLEPFDLVGFSYYSTLAVGPEGTFSRLPGRCRRRVRWATHRGAAGLGEVLHRLAEEQPDRPLLIDECGIGTDDDEWRATLPTRVHAPRSRTCHRRRHRRQRLLPLDRGRQLRVAATATTSPFGLFDRDRNARELDRGARLMKRYAHA